ncbi:hypothetical protein AAHE18_10G038400 [Arachis hypogaea]
MLYILVSQTHAAHKICTPLLAVIALNSSTPNMSSFSPNNLSVFFTLTTNTRVGFMVVVLFLCHPSHYFCCCNVFSRSKLQHKILAVDRGLAWRWFSPADSEAFIHQLLSFFFLVLHPTLVEEPQHLVVQCCSLSNTLLEALPHSLS